MTRLSDTAAYLSELVDASPYLERMSKLDALPLVCAKVADDAGFTAYDLSAKMKERGWIVPAYTLAADADHVSVIRVVVREGLSSEMADLLVADFRRAAEELGATLTAAPVRAPTSPTHGARSADPAGRATAEPKSGGDGTGTMTTDAPTTEFDPDPADDAEPGGFLPVLTSVIQRRWTSSVFGIVAPGAVRRRPSDVARILTAIVLIAAVSRQRDSRSPPSRRRCSPSWPPCPTV